MKRLETESGKGFSYASDFAQLEEYYEMQYEMIKKGNTDLATLELVMLGCALDFVSFVRGSLGIELDGRESSVELFDEVIGALARGAVDIGLFDRENSISKKAGAYLGFLIIANIGGSWIDTENGTAVLVEGREVYTIDFVQKRLERDSRLSAKEYYRTVKSIKGGT